MKTILITNRKGGVGKTTTTLNLASGFVKKGYKTLLVDLDTQGHIQYGLGIKKSFKYGIHSLIENPTINIKKVIQKTDIPKLSFIPADINYNSSLLQKKKALKKALSKVQNRYDICIIDTAPMSDTVLEMAIYASEYVIVPMKTEHLGLIGTLQFIKIFYNITSKLNTDFKLLGILPTLYNKSMKEHLETIKELEKVVGEDKVFQPIRRDTKLTNIFKDGIQILDGQHSRGEEDYEVIVDKILMLL